MPDVSKSYNFPANTVDTTYNITLQPDNATTTLADIRLEKPIVITQTVDKTVDIRFSVKSNDFSTAIGFTSGTFNAQDVSGNVNTSSSNVRTLSWSVTKPSAGAWVKYRDFIEDDFKTVSGGLNIIKINDITTTIDSNSPNPLLITAKVTVDQFIADEEIVLDIDNAVGVETDLVFTYNVPSGVNYTYNTGENITMTGQSGSDISKVTTYQKFINFKLTPASGYSWSLSNLPTNFPNSYELVSGGVVVTDKYLENYSYSIDSSGNLLLGYKLKQNVSFLTADTTITLQPKSGVSFNASNNVASNTNIIIKIVDSSGNKLTGVKYSNTSSNTNTTIFETNVPGTVSTQYTNSDIHLDYYMLASYSFKGLSTPTIAAVSSSLASLTQSVSIDNNGQLDVSIQFTPSAANASVTYTITAVNPIRQFTELKVGDNYTSYNSANADPVQDTQKYFINVDPSNLKIGDPIFKTVDSSSTIGVDNPPDGFVAAALIGSGSVTGTKSGSYIIGIIGGKVVSIEPRKVQPVITPPTMSGIQVVSNTMTSFGLQFDVGSYGSTKQGVYGYIVYTSIYDNLNGLTGSEANRNTYLRDTTPSVIPSSYLSSSTAPSGVNYSVVQNLYFNQAKGLKTNLTSGSQTLTAKKPKLSDLVGFTGQKNNSQGQSVKYQPTIYARVYLQNKDGSWMWSEQVEVPEVLDNVVIAQNPGQPTSVSSLDHGALTVEFGDVQSDGTYEALIKSSLTKASGDNTYLGVVLSEDDSSYPVNAVTSTSYPKDVKTNHVIHIWKNESYSLDSGVKFETNSQGKKTVKRNVNNPGNGILMSNPYTANVPSGNYNDMNFWLHIQKGLLPGKKYNYQVFAYKQKGTEEAFPPFFKNNWNNYRTSGMGYLLREFKSGTLTGDNARTGFGYGHPRDVWYGLNGVTSKYGPFEHATVVSNSNGKGSFTVPTADDPELTMTITNTEISYTEIELSVVDRGKLGSQWKESGILLSESPTLTSPRNSKQVPKGNTIGTIKNQFKNSAINTTTGDTFKVPFWGTDVTKTAFNSISSEKRNWPFIDGISVASNITPTPNSPQVPSGGLLSSTKYYIAWYIIDGLGNEYVGQTKNFTTTKDIIYTHVDLYLDPDTILADDGVTKIPAVCCPKNAGLKNDKTIYTDNVIIKDSTEVLTGSISRVGGNPSTATLSATSSFFRRDADQGYYSWDGTTFGSASCGTCPSSTGTPSGVPLNVPSSNTVVSKIIQEGLYQPCTVWDENISDSKNLYNASGMGWGRDKIIWVKLSETNTGAYNVGTLLTVKNKNSGATQKVKVGVPNYDLSGGYGTGSSIDRPATDLVPLISDNSTYKCAMPRNFGDHYRENEFANGPINKMNKAGTITSADEWSPQYSLKQTQWDISTTQNRYGSNYSPYSQRSSKKSNVYDFWDYAEEFSWYITNNSTVLSDSSSITIDNGVGSIGGVWFGSDGVKTFLDGVNNFGFGGAAGSGGSGVSVDRVGDYWLSWRVPKVKGSGLQTKKWGENMAYSSVAKATGNGVPTVTYGTSWFYQYRPNGTFVTFRRPLLDGTGSSKLNWQYTDSPRIWTQSAANNIVSEGRVRWVQLGTYRLGAFGGDINATGKGGLSKTGYAKRESAEVFSALLESGYTPSAITGSLVTSGWGGVGASWPSRTPTNLPSQFNKVLFDVPQNAGPIYLAKFTQNKDGYPPRKIFDRGPWAGSGESKFWEGNAFYDKTNQFWYTMGRNVWSFEELNEIKDYYAHKSFKRQVDNGNIWYIP